MTAVLPVVLVAALGLTPLPSGGAAPGAPGVDQQYLPASKSGLLTSRTAASKVWATVQRQGGLGEVFYPTIGGPSARALAFVVTSPGRVESSRVRTTQLDGLRFRQTFDGWGWRLTADYTTDPARSSVLVDLRFSGGRKHGLYAVYDPALGNSRGGDAGRSVDGGLVATDGGVSSALVGDFTATSSGFAGVSDGHTDLRDGRMDWRYTSAAAGSLVQTAQLRGGHSTLALAFGGSAEEALTAGRASLRAGFGKVARDYAYGWKGYLAGLSEPPRVLKNREQRRLWTSSALVLAAAEDKTHPGAYVAAPASPWAFGSDDPSGPYHLVWSRDLYQIATGLLAAGDRAGAERALGFLFGTQQKPDGSFPQNSQLDGTPVWGGLQLDEVALPIVLAYQLGGGHWAGVKKAADFLLAYPDAPFTPQERWENQSGYSPNTIATAIAGLVCAASIASENGDAASAGRYLATADQWRAKVKAWTVTKTGPYSSNPYFLRLTKDGKPDAGTTYDIGDSGPVDVDQRRVVDPGFLDLVRLGVFKASDPDVRNSLRVVDKQLGVRTPNGFFWHRASFDGFGERLDGSQWEYDQPDGSLLSRGRAWPLLSGERGEYEIAAGDLRAAATRLDAMTRSAGPGGMLPEQVWDLAGPGRPGTPTFSATPLTWSHAQYLRLARNLDERRVTEQPAVVAERYLG
ncbi:glycoside hydrolase family 15 protein [Paractinoplanes brasiliensis]|uniref:Glucoamylase n=1 Tax=Paractinoplanes brasiliensis TaxID=52695 RepID=A0A4R6K522_9ACTN|nr:glycoside hydrolase family 15 protein [Actinoplanes brasiliensis]TDO42345.1 glucoamylase [Actinoplanes brasiliensis]GID29577.1 glucan 1,4-alpha-glucosidase [Actinoplanes brasiliensis]